MSSNRTYYIILSLFSLFFLTINSSYSQTVTDSTTVEEKELTAEEKRELNQKSIDSLTSIKQVPNHIDPNERKRKKKTQYKSLTEPTKASFYTIVIPGLGQIYNDKAWKIPILYGGFAVFGYFIKFNHTNYIQSSHWLAYKSDADPTNDDLIPEEYRGLSEDNLSSRRDRFRRDRDFMIIVACGWYLLGALDAAVDQHMRYYDVSEDLSLKIAPSAIQDPYSGLPALGARLTLQLNTK
ncbi:MULTISPECIES: DUF5683 domain-containing protein [Flammeovirga]|uniref:DUF5683 domain-containing protein n=1 Tax=Flammeovirga agarivorans TaxID=2726742 RepID=A0A7X8XV96_9BACT|nr:MULTISPECIES: DUF5683 domain-containing protein [Flammeovirga]NLR91096.1 hypothetical protein [Flammeovirga agarivorans]